ncbi:MAG: thioredoxin-disulfide reductase [Alphaproteobacteria bacterium]|nr:thioredoxin-disulfide reductase [Alphaproteobacteria bacterium]
MAEYKTKILIIGSGPAGYTAGIYAARAGLKPILISGNQPGGQLTTTGNIENYPGFATSVSGQSLMDSMRQQALAVGCQIINDTIAEVDFEQKPFLCSSEKYHQYISDAVIIATGASTKWLNVAGEDKFKGWGVSSCATCDGFFYRGKCVAVVGGGNSAAEEALFLANLASQVILIHRRDSLRADKILQDRILKHPKIHILWNTVIEEIFGHDNPKSVAALKVKNVKNDVLSTLSVDGVFVAIGHTPNTSLFKSQILLDNQGYIKTQAAGSCLTNIAGIFAAGDVISGNFKQAVLAAGSGCMACLEAEKYLANLK